jgi:hypothetical protein
MLWEFAVIHQPSMIVRGMAGSLYPLILFQYHFLQLRRMVPSSAVAQENHHETPIRRLYLTIISYAECDNLTPLAWLNSRNTYNLSGTRAVGMDSWDDLSTEYTSDIWGIPRIRLRCGLRYLQTEDRVWYSWKWCEHPHKTENLMHSETYQRHSMPHWIYKLHVLVLHEGVEQVARVLDKSWHRIGDKQYRNCLILVQLVLLPKTPKPLNT